MARRKDVRGSTPRWMPQVILALAPETNGGGGEIRRWANDGREHPS